MDPKSKYAFVASLNDKGKVLLDVGCGFDSVLKLKRHAPLATFDGADIERYYMTEEGVRAMRNYWLFPPDGFMENLLSTGEQYDGIVLSHVIEHVKDPHVFLQQLVALLKDGGKVYVSTPAPESLNFPSLKMGCLNFRDDPTHESPFPLKEWMESNSDSISSCFIPRHRGNLLLYILGWVSWPYTRLTKRITPFTWYAFGFESIAILQKHVSRDPVNLGAR
jgi:ubiquinone/menaquinone biosynthesis C-methylase UbiE